MKKILLSLILIAGLASHAFAGIVTSGTVTANAFVGDGSEITNLNASNISNGTLGSDRLSGYYSISVATADTVLNTVSTASVALDSQKLNGQDASYYLNASNIETGTLDAARLSGTYDISVSTANRATSAGTADNGVVTTGSYADPSWITSLAGSKITGSVSTADYATNAGNAATVTNGVYTNGSYSNPSFITSLDGSKITGAVSTASYVTDSNVARKDIDNGFVTQNIQGSLNVSKDAALGVGGATETGAWKWVVIGENFVAQWYNGSAWVDGSFTITR